jgi:hypothetical protein
LRQDPHELLSQRWETGPTEDLVYPVQQCPILQVIPKDLSRKEPPDHGGQPVRGSATDFTYHRFDHLRRHSGQGVVISGNSTKILSGQSSIQEQLDEQMPQKCRPEVIPLS